MENSWIIDFGYEPIIAINRTFRSLIPNFSYALIDSIQARNPTKKLAEKSVYLPWLICKLITTIEAWFFHCIGPYLSIVQNRLWYPFETCIFNRVWFVTESGTQIAPKFVPILWISQHCPNRGYSQLITIATRSRVFWLFSGGIKPLSEPSVPSLRSYGSMRSRCILDGYEAFLTMRRSSPARTVRKLWGGGASGISIRLRG